MQETRLKTRQKKKKTNLHQRYAKCYLVISFWSNFFFTRVLHSRKAHVVKLHCKIQYTKLFCKVQMAPVFLVGNSWIMFTAGSLDRYVGRYITRK